MGRLIDADKLAIALQECIPPYRGDETTEIENELGMQMVEVFHILSEQPTAFDVDEIVKTMEEYKERADEVQHSGSWLDYMHRGYSNAMGFAIKLVKGGGVNETN